MRCPDCGKIFPSKYRKCNTCNKSLVSEEEYRKLKTNPNVPKCPICGSTDLKKLSALDRSASAFVWGLGSNKIGKTYECRKCKSTF